MHQAAAALVALGVLATASAALGAPLAGHVGESDAEREVLAALRDAGLVDAHAIPSIPLETTDFYSCPTSRACVIGPFPPTAHLSFGLIPLYEGTVDMSVQIGGARVPAFSCTVPGACEVVGTGSIRASNFRIVGDAAIGTVGNYVVWVTYE